MKGFPTLYLKSMARSHQLMWTIKFDCFNNKSFPDNSRICLQCRRPWFNSWIRKICWRQDRLPTRVFLGFRCGLAGKESTHNAGSLPGLGRSPGEGKGYQLQDFGLENSEDYIVHGIAKNWTWLSGFHFQFQTLRPRNLLASSITASISVSATAGH